VTFRTLAMLVILCFLLRVTAQAADIDLDSPCLKWDIRADQTVNKRQSRRLYLEAAHWLEMRFHPEGKPLRPCLTVHVGETCPLSEPGRICVSAALGDVYIPKWDEAAPALVAQATVFTGLLQLVTRQEIKQLSATLLAQDLKDFADVIADAKREHK
jgi:hypothetical protein